jgi:putative addiction module component (TIGR02574 family)
VGNAHGSNSKKCPQASTVRNYLDHLWYNRFMQSQLTEAARKLSIADRITLVEEIWDTIAEENQAFELTDAQKRELDRRLESSRANPGQGRTWEEIKAEFMSAR